MIEPILELSNDTPLARITVAVPRGTACDPVGQDGLLYHLAELATRGTATRSRKQLDQAFDALGASFGASATRESCRYHVRFLARFADEVCDLLLDILTQPQFATEEHQQLIRETENDLRELLDDDAALAARYFTKHSMPNHPYSRSRAGQGKVLKQLNRETFAGHFSRLMSRGQAIIGVAGGLDEDRAQRLHQRLSGGLPNSKPLERPEDVKTDATGRQLLVVNKPGRKQSQIVAGHRGTLNTDPDFPALLVAETAFGGMFSSRLMQEIRGQRGWSYGVDFHMQQGRFAMCNTISLAPSGPVTADALALAIDMFEDLVENGVRDDEAAMSKQYLLGNLSLGTATCEQRLRSRIDEHVLGLPPHFHRTLVKTAQSLSCDEINQAVRRHFRPEELLSVVVATASEMGDSLSTRNFGAMRIVEHDSY